MSAPPAYSTTTLEFYKPGVGKTFVDELRDIASSDPDKFLQHLENVSQQDETRQFFDAEIKTLCETIKSTMRMFGEVRSRLEFFDSQSFQHLKQGGASGGEYLPKLVPRWDHFQEDYVNLLNDSLMAAWDGMNVAQRYGDTVLDLALKEGADDHNVLQEITTYLEYLSQFNQKSQRIFSEFDELRVDIKTFKATMQAAMGDAINNVSQELRELDSLIETAQRNFNDKVKDVSTGIGSFFRSWHWDTQVMDTEALAPPPSDLLSLISPDALSTILKTTARHTEVKGTLKWNEGFSSHEEKYDVEQSELRHAELVVQDYNLYGLQLEFKKRESEIDNSINKMAMMGRIWKIFDKDARDLYDLIKRIPGIRTSPGMVRHIRMLRTTYHFLKGGLETYFNELEHLRR